MEEMKNLVIQTLETRGILGQIRAKLRSAVFKVVDDQDSKMNTQPTGCGLKWENPNLYKIKETTIGGLSAEMIREYLEYFKMDYSLSVFIPECSISPERLKKDEIHARLGLTPGGFTTELPFLYYIIYYFIESVQTNPEKVFQFLNKTGNNADKLGDDLIMRNYYNFQANLINEEEMQVNNPTTENQLKTNEVEVEENSFNDSTRNAHKGNNNNNNLPSSNIPNKNQNEIVRKSNNVNNEAYEFERLNVEDDISSKKYYDLDDIKTSSTGIKLDMFENKMTQKEKKEEPRVSSNINSNASKQIHNSNQEDSRIQSEIYEEIFDVEDSFQKSSDKKMQSWSNQYTSQSGGYDGTVDSNALEKYNYIEPVDKNN